MSINAKADGPAMVNSLEDAMALSESTKMPTLVIFGADWCGFCKSLKKDIESGMLNKELDNYIVCYIDIDKNKDLKKEFDVKTLPDSRILIDKKEISQYKGYDKSKYKKWINNVDK
jgi:thioredoxin-like negative regulator of GroEL